MDDLFAVSADELDDDLRAWVKQELRPGERVLWVSRARPRRTSVSTAYWVGLGVATFLGMIATAFLAACYGAFGGELQKFDHMLGTIGVLSGFVSVITLFGMACSLAGEWGERRKKAMRWYALTDQRAVFWCPNSVMRGVEVYTVPSENVENVHRVEFPDGHGNVIFKLSSTVTWECPKEFEGVAGVRRVEELARRVLRNPESTHPGTEKVGRADG